MSTAVPAHTQTATRRVALFGAEARKLPPLILEHPSLSLVEDDPDVVVCYGGDGTLLGAELRWPGVPKVPILNSNRGHRCIPHAPAEVIDGLAADALVAHEYTKIACAVRRSGRHEPDCRLVALNEFNIHMGRINSAVRFQIWFNDEPYDNGVEIIGDGLVVSTPFGSTAYFAQITRGIFTRGIGVAFKATRERIDHIVVPADVVVRVLITRGPAELAHDSAHEYLSLEAGDAITVGRHEPGATILTCGPIRRLDEPF